MNKNNTKCADDYLFQTKNVTDSDRGTFLEGYYRVAIDKWMMSTY